MKIKLKELNKRQAYEQSSFLSNITIFGPAQLTFEETTGEIDLGEPIDVLDLEHPADGKRRKTPTRAIEWKDWARLALGGRMYSDDEFEERIRSVYSHIDWKIVLRPDECSTSDDLFVVGIPR